MRGREGLTTAHSAARAAVPGSARAAVPGSARAAVLVAALAVALAGCRTSDRGEPAPFAAAPPTAVPAEAPAAGGEGDAGAGAATAEADAGAGAAAPGGGAGALGRIYGRDDYPCTGHPVCDEPSPEDGTLGLALGGAESIDPSLATEAAGFLVVENLFEGLLVAAPASGPPRPGVAERWEVAADGRTWTFHLRGDARWSNGRTVTAHDFVYAWRRKLDPATGSQAAEHHFFIEGARAFNEGKLDDPEKLGFRALDDRTLEVVLEEPTPFWLEYVKTGHYAPVPREAVEAHGAQWTRPEHIVTNGAYVLTEWKPRARMVLERAATYWDAANVRIPRVVIFHSESQEDDLTRYETGQVHITKSGVPTDRITRYIEEKRPDLLIDPFLAYYYYALRLDKPPFDDVDVRRALDMAIDKERLVKHITRGMQLPADGPVPPFFVETMGYPKPQGARFDPDAARTLLAQAGYANGVGLPPITIVYNTYEGHRLIAEFVQRSLKDNLGIEVAIENMEWKNLLTRLRTGDFQIARFGWIGIQDPYGFLKPFESDSANNVMAYASPELDALLDQSLRARDERQRLALLARAEALVQRDMPIVPLYYYTRVYLKKPVLRGYQPELNDVHLVKYLSWGDKEATP